MPIWIPGWIRASHGGEARPLSPQLDALGGRRTLNRRDLMALLGGAAIATSLTARAQQKAMPVIGQLSVDSPPATPDDLLRGPIRQRMSEMGFVEGQNMIWDYRWADTHYERLPALA